jgi:hypothetical protein
MFRRGRQPVAETVVEDGIRQDQMTKTPLSDHFDGDRFFNPTLPEGFAPSPLDTLRMVREPRSRWPAWVENKGVHRLGETLGPDEVAITFVNHATFLIQTGDITILTDPVWSERASPFRRIGPKRVRKPGVGFEDLPTVDIILLSHNHYDHLDIATLAQLRQRFASTVLAAAGDARLVGPLGFKSVHELDWWEEIRFNDTLKITFVPAQHFSARGLFDRRKSLWGGYMIEKRWAPCLFRGRHGILNPLLGHQDAPRPSRYRDAWNRQLRAAMVHEADSYESG